MSDDSCEFTEGMREREQEDAELVKQQKSDEEKTQESIKEIGDNPISYILTDLEKRAKRDESTKLSIILTGISMYLDESINKYLKGDSSIGKSFTTTKALEYFPEEDVWFIGGLSPKVLTHERGEIMDEFGHSINFALKPEEPDKSDYDNTEYKKAKDIYKRERAAWNRRLANSYVLVDLSHKLLVFLEAPDEEVFEVLLPILSHDKKEIVFKFTDKTTKGQFKSSKTVIRGYPATIFLSTSRRKYMEEFFTRCYTSTPEASKEKYEAANKLTTEKACYPWKFKEETKEEENIKRLIRYVRNKLVEEDGEIVVPFSELYTLFPNEIPRDMRDYVHFVQLIKSVAALHLYDRPCIEKDGKRYYIATIADVMIATCLHNEIIETTRTGMDKQLLEFYHDILEEWIRKEDNDFFTAEELTKIWNDKHKKKLNTDSIRRLMKSLGDIGYMDILPDPQDKRRNHYIPLSTDENTVKTGETETPLLLKDKLENNLLQTLKNIGENNVGYINYNSIEDIIKKCLYIPQYISPLFLSIKKHVKTENNDKKTGEIETPVNPVNSDEDSIELELDQLLRQLAGEEKTGNTGKTETPVSKDSSTENNVCDRCGRDSATKELDGDWLCEDCYGLEMKIRNTPDIEEIMKG